MPEPILDDSTDNDVLFPAAMERGLIPRDYAQYPVEMFDPPQTMKLIPRSEWSARIKEQEEMKSRTSDVLLTGDGGQPIPSMDQGPNGYCWGHSTVGCVQAVRAINNQNYIPLSAYAVCAIIKKGANEGGWSGLSAKFLREVGVPSQQLWPQGNRSLKLDTPTMRENAAKHKVTEDWVDLTRAVYDQDLSFDQMATCLLNNIPVAGDFNWWSHAIMLCDLVEVEAGSFGVRLRNSWGDGWGDRGFGILRGNKAIPDGALAIRATGGTSI